MESDSDYPYLKIYPPFSFYMNSESNPLGKEQQNSPPMNTREDSIILGADNRLGSTECTGINYSIGYDLPCDTVASAVGNSDSSMMPDCRELVSFTEGLLDNTNIQKDSKITNHESTVSNSYSIAMHNCRELQSFNNKGLPGQVSIQKDSNITNSDCTNKNVSREEQSSKEPLHDTFFENLCNSESTFDSSYAVEYDNISDIEYDVDSGFNSAATSPAPTDCIDDVNLLDNSNTSDRYTPSPSGSYSGICTSMALNPDGHHQFYGAHPANFPTKVTNIASTCIPVSNVIPANYGAPYRSLLHNSGGTCKMTGRYDTVTVNTCYPRMYAGPKPIKPMYLSTRYSPTKLVLASSPPLTPGLPSRMQLNSNSLSGYPLPQQTSNYSEFPFVQSFQVPYQGYIKKQVRLPATYTRHSLPTTEINLPNYVDCCVNMLGGSSQWKQNEFGANPEYFSYVVPSMQQDYNIPQTRHPNVYGSQRLNRCGETLQPVYGAIQNGYQPTRSEGVRPLLQDYSNVDSEPDHTSWSESFEEHSEDKHNSSQVFPDSTTHLPEPSAPKRTKGKASKVTTLNKPKETYMVLIAKAILASKTGRACLTEIYKHIMSQYSFYKETTLSWRNAVRHNLSTNECFVKAGKTETGRGFYWAIHPSCEEAFRKGNFDRRQARMKAQHASRTDEFLAMNKVPMSCMTSPPYSIHHPAVQSQCHFLPTHLSIP